MLEPSAGEGSFFVQLPPGSVGYDRQPKCAGVQEADFVTVEIPSERPIAVIGNPPFGKNSNMAIAFVNRAALFADVVAFILPRTFQKKAWIDARLDRHLHLIREVVIPDDAFVFNGEVCSVPSVFQIWERRSEERGRVFRKTKHPDFDVLKTGKGADFSIRRIGARAGRISLDLTLSPSSHYFLRSNVAGRRNLLATMWQLDFYSVSRSVAGQHSLSMSEIASLYEEFVTIEALSGLPPGYCCSPIFKDYRVLCNRLSVKKIAPLFGVTGDQPRGSTRSRS